SVGSRLPLLPGPPHCPKSICGKLSAALDFCCGGNAKRYPYAMAPPTTTNAANTIKSLRNARITSCITLLFLFRRERIQKILQDHRRRVRVNPRAPAFFADAARALLLHRRCGRIAFVLKPKAQSGARLQLLHIRTREGFLLTRRSIHIARQS